MSPHGSLYWNACSEMLIWPLTRNVPLPVQAMTTAIKNPMPSRPVMGRTVHQLFAVVSERAGRSLRRRPDQVRAQAHGFAYDDREVPVERVETESGKHDGDLQEVLIRAKHDRAERETIRVDEGAA